MKQKKSTSALQVNQVQLQFTKSITSWGGIGSIIASFLEKIDFHPWVLASIPITETSPNAGGVNEKTLALLLTGLCGVFPSRLVGARCGSAQTMLGCDVAAERFQHRDPLFSKDRQTIAQRIVGGETIALQTAVYP